MDKSISIIEGDDWTAEWTEEELQASADSYCIWTTNGSINCSRCKILNTPCDACLYFLPKETRKQLLRRCGRRHTKHLMDGEKCVLCGVRAPQNQRCRSNIWDEDGELSCFTCNNLCTLVCDIEKRLDELVAIGEVTENECEAIFTGALDVVCSSIEF